MEFKKFYVFFYFMVNNYGVYFALKALSMNHIILLKAGIIMKKTNIIKIVKFFPIKSLFLNYIIWIRC